MKRLATLLIPFFFLHNLYSQNWEILNSITTKALMSVFFIDVNTGYAVGQYGVIIKTSDGGMNWVSQDSGTNNYLLSVWFVNSNKGFIVGDEGIILKTTNGGENWVSMDSVTSNLLGSVCFKDQNIGFIGGMYGTFLKTINGGEEWSALDIESSYVNRIQFTDSNCGFALGAYSGSYILLKTIDGGINWITLDIPDVEYSLNSIYFIDSLNGYACGGVGDLLKTTNGGEDWSIHNIGSDGMANDIHFIDAESGLALCANTICETTNGGIDWVQQFGVEDHDLIDFYFINTDTGYVVGLGGIILKTTNAGGLVGIKTKQADNQYLIYPNPVNDFLQIDFPDDFISSSTCIFIYDIYGKMVLSDEFNQDCQRFSTDGLQNGIYVIKIINGNSIFSSKIIKHK